MKSRSSQKAPSKQYRLVRSSPRPLALEQRFMFDGAAVADAVDTIAKPQTAGDAGLLQFAAGAEKTSTALDVAQQQAEKNVADYLQQPNASQQLFTLFNGGQNAPSAQWQQASSELISASRDNSLAVRIELRTNAELQGALGAFATRGANGAPVIYLNADYVKSATSEAIQAVLIEEIGHAFDARLNPDSDSPGDEGQAFASLLLTGNANLNAALGENDHHTLLIDGESVAVEEAAPYGIAQVHFVPLPENDLQTAQKAIAGASAVSGNENTVIAITATAENTIIVYDHWEDGYEADISNPVQASTLVWGDGNLANGTAPGTSDDLIHAGQTIVLQNAVSPASPLAIDYDGRDKIASTQAVSVVRAGWSATPGTVLAGAVSVIDAGNAGTDYVVPIGQDVDTVATGTNRLFEYTSLHIIATQDGTTVNIDTNGDGTAELQGITLNQGETYFVNGGIMAGAHVTSNKGIGVYAVAGDVGAAYENRWFALTPTEQWASSYYAPVSTTLAADPSYVILYNPNAAAIDVYYDTATTAGTKITVAANTGITTGTNYVLMPSSAAHFYTKDGSKFYAVGVIDADATSNATHDWSYSLVPESYLTTKFVVGWGPGYDMNTAGTYVDGSPVWVTVTDDTSLYIDHGASMQVKDAAGNIVTGSAVSGSATGAYVFDVVALQSYRIFDTADKNQSGLTVYTVDGTLITAAWGEDPSIAGAGAPYLDMGTTVLPFPDYVFNKTSVEASPVTYGNTASNGNGNAEVAEQIEYTLTLTNRAVIDLYNINIRDAINVASANAASYVANSTTIKIIRADGSVVVNTTAIADDASGSPLDLLGYTLTDADPTTAGTQGLKRGDQIIIKYRVQVSSDIAALASAGFVITNDAQMQGSPAGSNTGITRDTSNQTVINVNGTYDGQVFIKDSGFAGVASTFQEGAIIGIEVVDNDANRSPTAINTLHVTVTNAATGETEDVTLTETGVNTNTFRATLATSTAASANNSGTLQFRAGDSIKADYIDPVYGVIFDNPSNPGVAGDGDGNIATGNANTAYASIAAPSETKILYLSDDSTNNLDRNQPPGSDTTAATTGQLVTSSGSSISITDNFGTSSASYTAGSGWSSGWTEVSESDGLGSGNIRVSGTTGVTGATSDNALYIRATGTEIFRNFSSLSSAATMTFDIKDSTSSRALEDGDYISVQQQISGSWTEVAKIYGTSTSTTYANQTLSLSAGATGIKFVSTFVNNSGDGGDRVYIDNVKIASGVVTTANTSGTTDYALSASASAGQTFSFSASGSTADAIAVDAITLSLKKTGTTAATATVSIRSAYDGTVLWSGTVSTASLSTTYKDVTFSPSGLTLDKSGSYVIRVDSSNSGIVWQGGTSDTYASGTRLTSSGAAATGDLCFSVNGHETGLTSVTFTQGQSMATDFIIPAGGVIKVITYVTNESNLGSTTGITAALTADGSTYTADTPVYNSSAHTLTWTFSALGAAKTVHAGQAVSLKITNASTNGTFRIDYDSTTKPSRIELPTTTVITFSDADPSTAGVQEVAFFNNSFANGGMPITSGAANAGDIVYIRFKVADPFGDYDISSLDLTIDGPGIGSDITLNMASAYVVNAASDGRAFKTYEYAWQTTILDGTYNIGVVAHEGTEGTVTDTASSSLYVAVTDLGTPSKTMFRTALAANSGVEAGAIYDSGANAYLRVTDLDKSGTGTVRAVVSDGSHSYTITLTEIGATGIFEADLGNAATHDSNDASQTSAQAATYFANLPNGTALTATYTDANDSTDTSSDSIVVNSPPTAVNNSQSIGSDKQATGNVITDDNNGASPGGVDTDPDASQTLTVTAVNSTVASVGDTITLASGARLLVNSDGSYIYDPSSLLPANQPTSGNPYTDSFTYTISDGQGGTSTATVTLTIDYVNPTVIDPQANTDGASVEFDVSNKFDAITSVATVQYTVTGLPSGLSIDLNTGIITGTIANSASTATGTKTYNVSVTASDVDNIVADIVRNFQWTVTNVVPVAVNDAKSTAVGAAVSGNMLTNDSDGAPDSDTLTVTKINNANYTLNANINTSHGTVKVTNANGAYTYTPNAGYTGADSFTYTISDGNGGTSVATVSLSIIGVNDISVNEGSPYAVFAVNGVANEQVSLALADGTATIDANGVPLLDGSEDYGPSIQYSADNGATWSTYSSGTVALNASGNLLVRTTIINDNLFEGGNAFTLNVANTLGGSDSGTATIHDDGTGQWFDGTSGTGSNSAPGGSSLNDDRPSFSIDDVTVNEAAGTMTFTVTKSGNTALASSVNYTTADDTASAGSDYTATSGTLNFAVGDITKTFTVSITNDALYERSEAFRINLSGASNAVIGDSQGIGTIKDDGTGDATHGGSGTGTNDDRALTVNNISVNEGSPYGIFTVTANIGETLTLALADGSANGSGTDYGTTGSDGHIALQYSTDGGSTWSSYTAAITVPGSGTGAANILVRTSITNDSSFEGAETFTLTAAYTSGIARSQLGTATIHDDGTGQWFDGTSGTGSNSAPGGSSLNDDRIVTVTGGSYNENSPRAVFTVNANLNQLLSLSIQDAAEPGKAHSTGLAGANLYYSIDGGASWAAYSGPITAGNVPVLVAVDITAERDNVFEGEEQLKLVVNDGQSTQASAYSSIFDDNTGIVTAPIDPATTGNTGTDTGATKDDDRAVAPPSAPPPALIPLPPAVPATILDPAPATPPPGPAFDSTLPAPSTPGIAPPVPENLVAPIVRDVNVLRATGQPGLIGDIYTSPTGFRIVVIEAPYAALTLFRGVADQYAETGSKSSFAVPYDAFAHSDPNERILLSASQSDGANLPVWVQFDANSGKFEFNAPTDFQGELKIKVTARDTKGNEVNTLFRFTIGEKRSGRAGLSEQLRLAGRDSARVSPGLTWSASVRLSSRAA